MPDQIDEQTPEVEAEVEIPEDYQAFVKFRETGELPAKEVKEVKAPAVALEQTPPSEPADEAGQIAKESDPEEEAEQEETDEVPDEDEIEVVEPKDKEPAKAEKSEKNTRLSKRMRELTGEIKALKSEIAGRKAQVPEEAEAEVVSATEPVVEPETAAPMLKDFEDTDEKSAWDQYEAATKAFNKAETAKAIALALTKQASELEQKHAKLQADTDWSKAAQRFENYNEVVSNSEVKINSAMEAVMRMDPEAGTAIAYYLGQHPEESERIAKATLAQNEGQWTTALARVGMEFGRISAKLTPPGKPVLVEAPVKPAPAPPPQPKKVTSASKPPTPIRGGTEQPKPDVLSDSTANDYRKWNRAREAQLKR